VRADRNWAGRPGFERSFCQGIRKEDLYGI